MTRAVVYVNTDCGITPPLVRPIIAHMDDKAATAYRAAFTRRVLVMRKAAGLTQEEVAKALGITLSGYQHYEASERKGSPGRSFMPHHLIPAFCKITGFPVEFLYGIQPGTAPVRALPKAE